MSKVGNDTPRSQVTLADFERALLGTNPFARVRVSEPSRVDVDVPTIHGSEFLRLKKRVEMVRKDGGAVGVLLLGSAGVGKSHLLSRLWRWALEHQTDYVFLHNVLASPERMPRYLTRAIVSTLVGRREQLNESRLTKMLLAALSFPAERIGRPAGPATIAQDLERACQRTGDGRVLTVLSQYLHAVRLANQGGDIGETHLSRAKAALDWLSCDSLEPERAALIDLASEGDAAAIEDDSRAEQVLCTLFDLGRAGGHPFVLCLDQVDNLDDERVRALTAFLHVIIDHARNLVVVTSGVNDSMMDFKRRGVISMAVWDRLAQHVVELVPVTPAEGREIIAARCRAFFSGFESVRGQLPNGRGPLFPLTEAFAKTVLDPNIEVRARDVIRCARDEWEELQALVEERGIGQWLANTNERPDRKKLRTPLSLEQAIDAAVRKRVRQAVDQRRLHPGTLPPDEDNLASLTVAALEHCKGRPEYSLLSATRASEKRNKWMRYDLLVAERDEQGKDALTGCIFLATQNANSTAATLRRIIEDDRPPKHQVLVTEEDRCPLRVAAKGKEYLQKLQSSGRFEHVKLDFNAYAHLDALCTAVSDAKVGDLEAELGDGRIRMVGQDECVQALHRTGLYKEHPLLHLFLTEPDRGLTQKPHTHEILSIEFAKSAILSQVTWRLGMDVEEVTRWVMQKRDLEKTYRDAVHETLIQMADILHAEGKIDATPTDNGGRFIQLLVKVA